MDVEEAHQPLLINNNNNNNNNTDIIAEKDSQLSAEENGCSRALSFAFSRENKHRKRNMALVAFVALSAIVSILLLVVLPNQVQSMVDKSHIVVLQTSIQEPSDNSFHSVVTQKFEHAGPFPASAKMKDLHLYWKNEESKEEILIAVLSGTGSVSISEGKEVQMSSLAHVPDIQALTDFNLYAQNQKMLHWRIRGKSEVTSPKLPGMKFNVDIDKPLELHGFDGFPVNPVVSMVNTTGGTPLSLINVAKSVIYSSADIALHLGQDLKFQLSYEDVPIGIGSIKDAVIAPGQNFCDVRVEMTPHNDQQHAQIGKLVSNFANGIETPVTFGPFFVDRTVAWLRPSLYNMKLQSVLPANHERVIVQSDMFPPKLLQPTKVPFQLTMHNPIDAQYTVKAMHSKIYTKGILLATVSQTGLNIVIPPRGNIVTDTLYSNPSVSLEATRALNEMRDAGFGYVDIYSHLETLIGEFPVNSEYNQTNTITYFHPK